MENCHFKAEKGKLGCKALKCMHCPENCSFAKTEKEYFDDIQHAKDILEAKGLEAITIVSPEGKLIMSTKKVGA